MADWGDGIMPISCHFRDCKALLVASLTHVSGAITSVKTFTIYPFRRSNRMLLHTAVGYLRDIFCTGGISPGGLNTGIGGGRSQTEETLLNNAEARW